MSHTHTHTHRYTYNTLHAHTHKTHQGYTELLGLKNPGGWWVVMAGDRVCFTLRQMESGSFPSERLQAVFSPFFFPFFITAWLTASAFYQTSIVYLCSVQSHLRWQAIRGEPLPFHSLPLFSLSFISSVSFLSFCAVAFCHHNKWVLNWRAVSLSPMEVHSFIIRSGKPRCKLGVIIMWRGIIRVHSEANPSMCLDPDEKLPGTLKSNEMY